VIVNGYLWRHQLEDLSSERRCIALDLLGHGRSEASPGQDVSFEAQAAMLAQFLDALSIPEVDLIANDSGTGIAQIFAAIHPEWVRTLTLTNGDVQDNWPPEEFSGFLDMVAAGGLAETIAGMADDKDCFRSADGLGGAYEHPENVSDETIDAYLRPLTDDPQTAGFFTLWLPRWARS
jgi:pimeloyl-ACP methyl ester carboxylesterase